MRVLEEFDDFLQFFLGFFNTRDIFESDFLLLRTEQAGAGFSEAQGLVAAGLHLANHEDPEQRDEDERAKGEDDVEPFAAGNFLDVDARAFFAQRLDDILHGFLGHDHVAELLFRLAKLALHFGTILRNVDGDLADVALFDFGEEFGVVAAHIAFARRLAAGGSHLPQHDGDQDHEGPEEYGSNGGIHPFPFLPRSAARISFFDA